MNKSSKYLVLSIITFIIGYVFLKTAYASTNDSFLDEVILIILGTIVTIAITASLLNKQSEVELEKEQRIKIFDIKSSLYFDLINLIEKVILKREITEVDLINLEFLTHKISVIADISVLEEYSKFVKVVKKASSDIDLTKVESKELSTQLNKLCSKIRRDLIGESIGEEEELEELLKKLNT